MEMLNVDGVESPTTVLAAGDRVLWNHTNPEGWAGAGIGTVLRYDPARRFFGGPVGSGNPGPAYEIELETTPKRHVWAAPKELDPIE